ncbi:hypothetical protein E1B28_006930 [Marasmius oreades]|uniref:Uncharacterized protein n=1 Tax=Marasmius oreades TaxID=181124 RepID=A0A9P7UVE7_9AGAR|nr:uncharacterized protein E1B28_006930 [Marasmius oreades]KAG7093244.1 hypothetical protein E1B28_006930 [Marasmius oreades]
MIPWSSFPRFYAQVVAGLSSKEIINGTRYILTVPPLISERPLLGIRARFSIQGSYKPIILRYQYDAGIFLPSSATIMRSGEMSIDKAHFLSLWMETLLYGINTALFLIRLYVLFPSKMRYTRHTVFLVTAVAMYALCTAHVVTSFVRAVDAFFGAEGGGALNYYGEA